jgi:hypothetical protein
MEFHGEPHNGVPDKIRPKRGGGVEEKVKLLAMCRFRKISDNKEVIDKKSFQENMGILGITSVEGFSDRLFNSFDTDTDGKVSILRQLDFIPGFRGVYGDPQIGQRKEQGEDIVPAN